MGAGIDMYIQEGIDMDIALLVRLIEAKKQLNASEEYITGMQDALEAIKYQKKTFPWD